MSIVRTPMNPWDWSKSFGYNQGELVSGASRFLYCSGQTAMSKDGVPQHNGDLSAQLRLSLSNLEVVLRAAGMSLANVVRLNVYATDIDRLMPNYEILASRLREAGVAPTTTMLEVKRLAIEGQMVELEATAVD